MPNPIVSKIQLGMELRRLREAAGVSREQAARVLDCDLSKVSRLESGKSSLRTPDANELIALYEVPPELHEEIRALAKESRSRTTYRVSDWAQKYTGLEQAASELRKYETELVPGLMQTEDYARVVTLAFDPERPKADLDRLIAGRLDRQRILDGPRPPRVVAVLNEAVVQRVVGSVAVMDAQLRRLVELAERPTVSLHLLPFAAGAHAAMGYSFVLLDLPAPFDVRIVYLEDLASGDYLDQPPQIKAYSLSFERLLGAALGQSKTVDLLDQVRKNLYR